MKIFTNYQRSKLKYIGTSHIIRAINKKRLPNGSLNYIKMNFIEETQFQDQLLHLMLQQHLERFLQEFQIMDLMLP